MSGVLDRLGTWLGEVGISGIVDISIMAFLIHFLLVWLKRTRRAAAVLKGILIVAGIYLFARQFDLFLTAAVLHGFFAVILVALVVIFQEELRYLFERVARWGLQRRRSDSRVEADSPRTEHIALLARTLTDLSERRWGAIVVLTGKDTMDRHIDSGQSLNGDLSEAILKSVFDPHSIGHDGAALLERRVVRKFGCHLPLSKNTAHLGARGTRHAAALGLSERVDALCLVVSEERGSISAARHGKLLEVPDAGALVALLEEFYRETETDGERRFWTSWTTNQREKLVAVALSVALWFVLVHEARVVYRTFRVPVDFGQLPAAAAITGWTPSEVEVTLSGARKSFYFTRLHDIRFAAKTWDLETGKTTLSLGSADFELPDELVFEGVQPRQLELRYDAPDGPRVID